MSKKENRTRKFTVRFTENEYSRVEAKFKQTTSSQLSHYMRQIILDRPVVFRYRNESLDQFMEELIGLKQELNAIGNNFNQAVKKLHTLKTIPEFRQWIVEQEATHLSIQERTGHIENRIVEISDRWLQG